MKMRQVLELPLFPCSLSQDWAHPDIFAAIISRKFPPGFVFQPLKNSLDEEIASIQTVPGFIWLIDSNVRQMPELLSDFFQKLQKQLKTGDDQAFSIKATDPLNSEAAGACWKIMYLGIPCGEIHIYSELKGFRASSQLPLLRLDLGILQKCILKDFYAEICWQQSRPAGKFLADFGWKQSQEEIKADVINALTLIVSRKLPNDELFGNLLVFYNRFSPQMAADKELDLYFISIFSDCITRLIQTEGEAQNC